MCHKYLLCLGLLAVTFVINISDGQVFPEFSDVYYLFTVRVIPPWSAKRQAALVKEFKLEVLDSSRIGIKVRVAHKERLNFERVLELKSIPFNYVNEESVAAMVKDKTATDKTAREAETP